MKEGHEASRVNLVSRGFCVDYQIIKEKEGTSYYSINRNIAQLKTPIFLSNVQNLEAFCRNYVNNS
jgi:hypothetical protein